MATKTERSVVNIAAIVAAGMGLLSFVITRRRAERVALHPRPIIAGAGAG
jgi:hypothetical protein